MSAHAGAAALQPDAAVFQQGDAETLSCALAETEISSQRGSAGLVEAIECRQRARRDVVASAVFEVVGKSVRGKEAM